MKTGLMAIIGLIGVLQLAFVFLQWNTYAKLRFTQAAVVRHVPADMAMGIGHIGMTVLRVAEPGRPAQEIEVPTRGVAQAKVGDSVVVAFSDSGGYHAFSQREFFRNLLYGVLALAAAQLALCALLLALSA